MVASNRCSLFRVDGLFTHHYPQLQRGTCLRVPGSRIGVAGSVDPG